MLQTAEIYANLQKIPKNSTPTFAGGWYATIKTPFWGFDFLYSTPSFTGGWYVTSEFPNMEKATKFIAHLLLPAGGMLFEWTKCPLEQN